MCSNQTHVHCFEAAGLGKAPFKYVGMEYQEIADGQRVLSNGATTKPGGSCAYCSTYIVNMFAVESADGKRFVVGCECIRKTGDAGLIKRVNEDMARMERQRRTNKRLAKERADETYCREMLTSNRAKLQAIPHPTPARAEMGETLANYADWMIAGRYFKSLAATLARLVK